jgi:hypothetical protein
MCSTELHVVTPLSDKLANLHAVTPFLSTILSYMLLHPFGRFTCCYTIFPDYFVLHVVTPFWSIYMLLRLILLFQPKIHADTPIVVIPFRYFSYRFTHFSHFCHFSMLKHCCFVTSAAIFFTLSDKKCRFIIT